MSKVFTRGLVAIAFVVVACGTDNAPPAVSDQNSDEPAPTIDAFTTTAANLPVGGGSVTLAWVTTDATELTIDNGVGTVTGLTSATVTVVQTTTFTLTATSAGGTSSAQVNVTVAEPTAPPTITTFTVFPSQLPVTGGNVTLGFAATDAVALSIDNEVGDVTGKTSVKTFVTTTTTFTLTATNALGSSTAQTTATVYVPTTPPVINSLSASPTSLPAGGGNVTIAWNTRDAETFTLDGTAAFNTSAVRNITATHTFTLVATNRIGSSTETVTVNVAP